MSVEAQGVRLVRLCLNALLLSYQVEGVEGNLIIVSESKNVSNEINRYTEHEPGGRFKGDMEDMASFECLISFKMNYVLELSFSYKRNLQKELLEAFSSLFDEFSFTLFENFTFQIVYRVKH